jgi:signal transduction histidine kinase
MSREKIRRHIDQEVCYNNIFVYPLIANGSQGVVLRIDDVTERVRFEEMMIQTEKMMSVGGLAAGMAHEINNPLGGIVQSAQNIIRRISPELPINEQTARDCGTDLESVRAYLDKRNILKFLESIRESGQRAAKIVGNMLNFSRQSESLMAPVNLPELLNRSTELAAHDYNLKKKYDFRHIEIIRDFAPDLPKVPCTATEIEQVILNLIRNAAQAMSGGKGQMSDVKGHIILRLKKEENMARIEVEDNGPGMDEKTLERIFEPFFTTKEVGTGTGLGLSVSYFIITNNHKGTIKAESVPGKGTKFIIHLPLNQYFGQFF